MNEYLKSGRQALRSLYFLIIGLALTKSISTLFASNGVTNQFSLPNLSEGFLFLVFMSFITRFSLGAYRVLSADIEIEHRRPKIVCDIIGFFIQALAFYVYSVNFYDLMLSQYTIIFISLTDLIWLLILRIGYKIRGDVDAQWLKHNVIIILLLGINILVFHAKSFVGISFLIIVSAIAAALDFVKNADFYFSTKNSPALRIFVAGPYGDSEPKKVIETNVDRAREIGKELALKGHFPFIPHTMLHGWETDKRFTVENFKSIDFQWLDFCDALYFIAPSTGANIEKERASKRGLQIFTSLDAVPTVVNHKATKAV
jgi:hypothetical protein